MGWIWLIALEVSMIINQLIDKYKRKTSYYHLYGATIAIAIIIVVFINLVKDNLNMANAHNNTWYYKMAENLITIFNFTITKVIIIIALSSIIFILISINNKKLFNGKKLSKIIRSFTFKASDNSYVSLISGDMDFFGKVDGEDNENIDTNEEYKQLLNLKERIRGLRIICDHTLKTDVKNSIINDTYSIEDSYRRLQSHDELNQVLRIGKLRDDFGDSIEFRFYDDNIKYGQLRARFVKENSEEVIVYYNTNRFNRKKERLFSYDIFPASDLKYTHYQDLFDVKWNNINEELSKRIVKFCYRLYLYHKKRDVSNRFALVYVESYEVAHFGKKRKEFPPFGVMYLAAVIRQQRWNVDVIAISDDYYKYDFSKYDVVGLSIVSSYSYGIFKKCCDASKFKESKFIVAGGYHAERFKESVFKKLNANLIFSGEGENSMRDFLDAYEEGTPYEVKGIYYRKATGGWAKTEDRDDEVNLDTIPMPARDELDIHNIVMTDRLAGSNLKMVHVLFSRGCAKNCYYCAANHDKNNSCVRYRNPIKIKEELQSLKENYNIDGFAIIDDCFLTDKQKAKEICHNIMDLNLKWSLAARVDQIDNSILEDLQKAGCVEIKFGIETGSDAILKKMNKRCTVNQAKKAIKMTNDHGLKVKVFIISGLPFETEETNKETMDFLSEMGKEKIRSVSLLRFAPLPGSYIYDHPKEFGINPASLCEENFKCLQLYKTTANWWEDNAQFELYQELYDKLRTHIFNIWGEC